jgi:hypothetical protein
MPPRRRMVDPLYFFLFFYDVFVSQKSCLWNKNEVVKFFDFITHAHSKILHKNYHHQPPALTVAAMGDFGEVSSSSSSFICLLLVATIGGGTIGCSFLFFSSSFSRCSSLASRAAARAPQEEKRLDGEGKANTLEADEEGGGGGVDAGDFCGEVCALLPFSFLCSFCRSSNFK